MHRTGKILLSVLVVLSSAVALGIILFDWNMLRGYVERKVTERTGRAASIGHLDVDLSLTPRISLREVRLGNAPWGTEPWMVDARLFSFSIELLPLLQGRLVMPELLLSEGRLVLERSADGQRNWILKKEQSPRDEPPVVQRLRVDRSQIVFRDPAIDTDVTVALSSDSAAADPVHALRFQAQGKFKGQRSFAQGTGGSVLALRAQKDPYPIRADIRIGATQVQVTGQVSGLAPVSAVDLALKLRGPDLAQLYPVFGVALPPTPPYRIVGRLQQQGQVWDFRDFSGRVGDSDLSGSVQFDRRGDRPRLQGELVSRVLDFDDLAGFVGTAPAAGPGETASPAQKRAAARRAQATKVLPDTELNVGRLNAMDADVRLKARSIRREGLPLDNLEAHFRLDDGVLRVDPLNFGVAGGKIVSSVMIDGRRDRVAAELRARFTRLRLDRLFPGVDLTRTSVGSISGRAALAGEGNSLARLLASADGELAAVIVGGQVSNLLLEFAGIDGAEIIKFLLAGDRNARLRCAVADFAVSDGLMKTRAFVFDTSDTNITGEGTVDLKAEELDLTLIPLPKDMSILSARAPLRVSGTFKKPEFAPDKGVLAARGGAAVILGALVNPLAALLPLIETGPGKDSDCASLVALATRKLPGRGNR